ELSFNDCLAEINKLSAKGKNSYLHSKTIDKNLFKFIENRYCGKINPYTGLCFIKDLFLGGGFALLSFYFFKDYHWLRYFLGALFVFNIFHFSKRKSVYSLTPVLTNYLSNLEEKGFNLSIQFIFFDFDSQFIYNKKFAKIKNGFIYFPI